MRPSRTIALAGLCLAVAVPAFANAVLPVYGDDERRVFLEAAALIRHENRWAP